MDGTRKNIMIIKINEMKLFGYHGLYDVEKENGQDFVINIAVELAYQAESYDSIDSAVDYVEIAKIAKEIFNNDRYNLIETLAVEISNSLMENNKIDATTVSIKKVSPPIDLDLESIEVEYRQERG